MDIKLAALKASADLTRQWLVVDLDAFFASVEELDDPSLVIRMPSGPAPVFFDALHVCKWS